MPIFTDDELREAIAEGSIRAVSLDTNVFHQLGYDLNVATLRKLDQFKETNISVIFSEIIVREVKKHISDKAEETRSNLASSLRKYQKRWRAGFDFDQVSRTVGIDGDPVELASNQVSEFIDQIGASIVPVNGNVEIDDLTGRYFDIKSPFENNAKKKAEFPDAMALLSLEAWAMRHGGFVLLVSVDSGWQKFAEESERLICLKSIEVALDHFNDAGRFVADQAVSMLRNGAAEDLTSEVDTTIQARLDDNDFSIEADSHLSLDWDGMYATLQHWEVAEFSHPRIIASDDETVTFAINLSCIVEFTADFYFSVYDSVDKDHVNMGSEEFSKENTIQLSAVLSIGRELDPEPELIEASITTQRIEADFGYIEPDWGYEE